MEATGVYYESLAYYLEKREFTVHVVLPNQSKKYGQSLGIKSKTDKIDARILSRMGLERCLRLWQAFSTNFHVLKQLTRERDALIRSRTSASNQLHAYEHQGMNNKQSIERSYARIELINQQITEIEKEIKSIVQSESQLSERLNYVLSIKGVSLITAVTVLGETNGFAAINNIKQLTSYAGLDVKIAESGKWKGKSKISKCGNSYIRKSLYFPAFSKIRHDPQTQERYRRLKEKKAVPMVAAVAEQRKLPVLIYTLWRKKEFFNPAA